MSDASVLEKGKVMVFPLEDIYREHKSITGFLTDLIEVLKQGDAIEALEGVNGSQIQKWWGWLSKYFKIEPGFFGFNVKINDAIKDLLDR